MLVLFSFIMTVFPCYGLFESWLGFSAVFYHDVSVSARAQVLYDSMNYVGYEGPNGVG